MKYERTSLKDPFMNAAYQVAKGYYQAFAWNVKTTPVAILVKKGQVQAIGVSGNGMHPLIRKCYRSARPGSPYSDCSHCQANMHAEMRALQECKTDPKGSVCYVYGHWRCCSNCEAAMEVMGVKKVVLLDGCETLFDRHHKDTVIGTSRQFEQ